MPHLPNVKFEDYTEYDTIIVNQKPRIIEQSNFLNDYLHEYEEGWGGQGPYSIRQINKLNLLDGIFIE